MKLTEKEQALYDSVVSGMDEPGSGWLHELAPCGWSDRSTAGVLSSLIKKGLVDSHKEPPNEPGAQPAYWITVVNKDAP
jgi:hypothetical protein